MIIINNNLMITGVDVQFLKQAIQLTKNSVYSVHKTSTREVS